jgi:hypothetical protein
MVENEMAFRSTPKEDHPESVGTVTIVHQPKSPTGSSGRPAEGSCTGSQMISHDLG